MTRHSYEKPRESILFNSKWASILLFVDLPYEMKCLGVLSSVEEGTMFAATGLSGPIDRTLLTAEGTLRLLDCLKT